MTEKEMIQLLMRERIEEGTTKDEKKEFKSDKDIIPDRQLRIE